MAQHRLTDKVLIECLEAVDKAGSVAAAARLLGINRSTFESRIANARNRFKINAEKPAAIDLPTFPDDDIPVDEILDTMERRFTKRAEAAAARRWFTVSVQTDQPIGLCFVGDPHIDSNGCNISLLRRDIELMTQPGMYCVNLGDTTDGDWPGRLMRLHAKSDQSMETARRLAEWFLNDTVEWLAWIMGNHDLWGADSDLLKAKNIKNIPMSDWAAKWQIEFDNGRRCKIVSSHDFAGRSIWNSLHSNQRAATTTVEAHIFASGHTHNWAIHQEENAHREFVYWLIRSRGYKYIDSFGERLGHASQQHGATICAVIDPLAKSEATFVQCFSDLAEASEYLIWKRSKK